MSGSKAKDAEVKKTESNERNGKQSRTADATSGNGRSEEKGGGSLDEAASKSHQ